MRDCLKGMNWGDKMDSAWYPSLASTCLFKYTHTHTIHVSVYVCIYVCIVCTVCGVSYTHSSLFCLYLGVKSLKIYSFNYFKCTAHSLHGSVQAFVCLRQGLSGQFRLSWNRILLPNSPMLWDDRPLLAHLAYNVFSLTEFLSLVPITEILSFD